MRSRRTGWVVAVFALWLGAAGAPTEAAAAAAPLRLRWEVEHTVVSPQAPDGRSLAALTLTNLGDQALPAQGWAVYFNCIAGVELGPALAGEVTFENVSGTWFRLRPSAGFKPLAPGQSVSLRYLHPEVMVKSAKAPTGPYLVVDSAPEVGLPITDYQIEVPSRAEQIDGGPSEPPPLISAQDLFRRNQAIDDVAPDALPPVFPTPRHFERRSGSLRWTALPRIKAAPALQREAALAAELLKPYFATRQADAAAPALRLAVGVIAGQSSPEAYQLTIAPDAGVLLKGRTAAGVARGLQSLRELLPLQPEPAQGLTLPAWFISDAPRFDYRGVMLDVARNFHPKATVLRLLDLMARYKLNKFHFHLTDDEGWRLEIAGLPELTTVGARRGHTLDSSRHLQPAYGSGPDVADPHGSGHYTRADYIEILRYAAARRIEVIPEIEMPGHARAAVKAMQARGHRLEATRQPGAHQYLLSDPDDRSQYRSPQNYTDQVINPGLPSTYAFIEHVVAEVVALHRQAGAPLRTIHVGADELLSGAWEKSPASLALMKRLKLATTADLWDYFYDRVDRILRRHGLFASGWEELGARKVTLRGLDQLIPNPRFVQRGFELFVWNNTGDNEDLAYRLANAGYRVVLAPATTLYFDMAHNRDPQEPGVNWAGYADLDTLYDFVPFDFIRKSATDTARVPGRDGLTDPGRRNVLGIEGTLFTEAVREQDRLDYLLMPRLLGLAERAWAADPAWAREADSAKTSALHDAAWSVFVNQLGKRVLPRLDHEPAAIRYRIPPPGLMRVDGRVAVNHELPGMTLRFTTDGSEPGPESALVSGAIDVRGIIKVAAFDRNGRQGRTSRIDNP